MTDQFDRATWSRLRAELATAVAAATERENQLQEDLHERFVETAELTRLLLVAEQESASTKRQLKRAREQIAVLEQRLEEREIGTGLPSRARERIRQNVARLRGKN